MTAATRSGLMKILTGIRQSLTLRFSDDSVTIQMEIWLELSSMCFRFARNRVEKRCANKARRSHARFEVLNSTRLGEGLSTIASYIYDCRSADNDRTIRSAPRIRHLCPSNERASRVGNSKDRLKNYRRTLMTILDERAKDYVRHRHLGDWKYIIVGFHYRCLSMSHIAAARGAD